MVLLTMPTVVVVSLCNGVGGCGWQSSSSVRQKTLASCAFRNSAPSLASAVDAAMSLRMVHCTWIAPLSLMGSPSRGKLPRKK